MVGADVIGNVREEALDAAEFDGFHAEGVEAGATC
jgi:hypothetical protein